MWVANLPLAFVPWLGLCVSVRALLFREACFLFGVHRAGVTYCLLGLYEGTLTHAE